MIFIGQINKVPRVILKYEFNNIRRLQNFSTAVQSILCQLNFQINSPPLYHQGDFVIKFKS